MIPSGLDCSRFTMTKFSVLRIYIEDSEDWCIMIYRDFKNKLQKVDDDFRPFRSSEMHENFRLVIIRVGFLKIENKNLVIEVVEELWRFDFISVQKFNFSETFNFCTKRCLNLTSRLKQKFSPKFKVWLILFRILWKVLLPKSKNRNKMSHGFQKLLKRHVSTFLEILYRTVVFLTVFVEEIFKICKNPYVIILQASNSFKKISQKSNIPLKLW